jgi:hypothetical protein
MLLSLLLRVFGFYEPSSLGKEQKVSKGCERATRASFSRALVPVM